MAGINMSLSLNPSDGALSENPAADSHASKKFTQLLDLPVEILQTIAEFLLPVAAASFSLCSHRMKYVLGTQYLDSLREVVNQEEHGDFLFLLRNRWPEYVMCQACYMLHPTGAIPPPCRYTKTCAEPHRTLSQDSSNPFQCPSQGVHRAPSLDHWENRLIPFQCSIGGVPEYKLNAHHIQMVLTHHHHGSPYGMGLDKLKHTSFQVTNVPNTCIFTAIER